MGSWNEIFNEIVATSRISAYDQVRRKYLRKLADLRQRNVVAYYSGFLQKTGPDYIPLTSINDDDKNALMGCLHGLDFDKGLDLILHSPGGDVAATESIINYLRSKFGHNIRTIVPQLAMSGGTMLALAGKEIVMARHSNLGPIDPQFGSWPAKALLDEFERAKLEVAQDPTRAPLWHAILQHYQPTLLSKADRAVRWSKEIATRTLLDGMLNGVADGEPTAERIVDFLLAADVHYAHNRHIHRDELRNRGLTIVDLEDDAELQDAVLSVHHAFMNTLANTPVVKIVENHIDIALIKQVVVQMQALPIAPAPIPQPPPPLAPPAPAGPAMPGQLPWNVRWRLALKLLLGR